MPTKPKTPRSSPATLNNDDVLIDVNDLDVHFPLPGGLLSRVFGGSADVVKAVDGVSFQLRRGEVLGLVGESGSGKTTLGRALLGMVRPTTGTVSYDGDDLGTMRERDLRRTRRHLQMVFQDPHAALNPSMTIQTAVGHPLRIHKIGETADEQYRLVCRALERVGLSPVERFLSKYPGDLSGGQKQRAVFARAIIAEPELLVADEPISMLDMSVRAKILDLMLELKADLGLTYVYITHDLATAKFFCDRVAICYLGRIVELGPTEEIFADPKHPYTKALLQAIPEPDPTKAVPRDLPRGEIPDAASPPQGCAFHPRCPMAFDRCGWETRDLRALLEQHWLALDETTYEAERSTIANLDTLDTPGKHARLAPSAKHDAGDVLALLQRIQQADPDEPLWTGVRRMEIDGGVVVVEFVEGADPRLRPADGIDVACHLY